MILTEAHDEMRQEALLIYQAELDTLEKEPDDNSPKQYAVVCHTAADWNYIHLALTTEGTTEVDVPSHSCKCMNECLHTETMGKYILSPEEASQLEGHSKVKSVNVDYSRYWGTYKPFPLDLICGPVKKTRNNTSRKFYRDMQTSLPFTPGSSDSGRSGYQLLRCGFNTDPWWGLGSYSTKGATVLNSTHEQYGDGSNVDLIVTDTEAWYGHAEFINKAIQNTSSNNDSYNSDGAGPSDYRGGNVLPGNGYCDVLDVVLDAPYYLDPDFFNADPSSRLMTRWDGTIVPVESYARNWWGQNSLTYRSSKFVSISNGGTATGVNDFGVISVTSAYTRDMCNGSNTARNTYYSSSTHATQCMGVAYGRNYGWAYNANKWHVNNIGYNAITIEESFNLCKVFHNVKPVNPLFGTKDPTITSNSWGYRSTSHRDIYGANYFFYRHGRGSSPGSYSGYYTSTGGMPYFLIDVGYYGDGYRMKGEMVYNSMVAAGDAMIDAGVIFVVAAGNSNQKQVQPNHTDFDNFWTAGYSYAGIYYYTHQEFSINCYNTTNRPGFPQQLGRHTDGNGNTVLNKVINVGALDYSYQSSGHERKVNYSDSGNGIDVYAPADDTLSSTSNSTGEGIHPESYPESSLVHYDDDFGGTSAACPVTAGLIATKLQWNRNWGWSDVKSWIQTIPLANPNEFYYGTDVSSSPFSYNDGNWRDANSLQGGSARVIYDLHTGNEPDGSAKIDSSDWSILEGNTLTLTVYTRELPTGTYYYTIEDSQGDVGVSSSKFTNNSLEGSFSHTLGGPPIEISLTPSENAITLPGELLVFRVAIRTGSSNGEIIAMTDDIFVDGYPDPVPFVFTSGGTKFSGVKVEFS